MELTESLLRWLATFSVSAAHETVEECSDGLAMAQVLHVLAPDSFDSTWLSKVSAVGGNKRLKLANLRKVLTGTLDYLKDVVGMQLSQFPLPDINQVVECDSSHLGRLLQLILGVAINCGQTADHIQAIMEMDSEVQRVVMMAIQEMHGMPVQPNPSLPIIEDDAQVKRLMEEMESTKVEKELLAQKCHELEMQLNLMKEEKSNLSAEFEHLQARMGTSGGKGVPVDSGIRYKELKKENETLKTELESMEAAKDESQAKCEDVEARLEESEEKVTELQKLADQARILKDEVDVLRETSEKVGKYEAIIETYKKKLDEMGDLKRQIKYLEEKNSEYIHNNMDLEEELGKVSKKKPQTDLFRKQVSELNTQLTAETERADKIAFENAKLLEKLEAISVERERLLLERDQLKETLDDLQCIKAGPTSPDFGGQLTEEPDSGMLENIPPSIKARLVRLEKENTVLRKARQGNGNQQELQDIDTMVQDMKDRETALTAKNREANKRLMELEARLEEAAHTAALTVPRIPGSREELELKVAEANKKVSNLTETLAKKEADMAGMEERYKKYIEKAKSVIKTLDPKQNPNVAPEVSKLKSQLVDKDKVIDELEKESEKCRAIREMEERLMATAFYDMGMKLHRGAVEDRLKNLSQGQSFLARQRQVNTRKGGYGGQEYYYD